MDFINSLSPARKKSILAVAILVVVALVIVVGLRLMGSSEADTTAAASGAQSVGPGQSGAPQSIAKTITPQSAGPANTTGSMGTDADAGAQASYVMTTRWDAYADPEQAQATDLSSVLTESALEEFDAKALEWTTEGLYSEGTPTIENPQVIEDDGAGNVTVSVCVDSLSAHPERRRHGSHGRHGHDPRPHLSSVCEGRSELEACRLLVPRRPDLLSRASI